MKKGSKSLILIACLRNNFVMIILNFCNPPSLDDTCDSVFFFKTIWLSHSILLDDSAFSAGIQTKKNIMKVTSKVTIITFKQNCLKNRMEIFKIIYRFIIQLNWYQWFYKIFKSKILLLVLYGIAKYHNPFYLICPSFSDSNF